MLSESRLRRGEGQRHEPSDDIAGRERDPARPFCPGRDLALALGAFPTDGGAREVPRRDAVADRDEQRMPIQSCPYRRAGMWFWRGCAQCHRHGVCQNLISFESDTRPEPRLRVLRLGCVCLGTAPG